MVSRRSAPFIALFACAPVSLLVQCVGDNTVNNDAGPDVSVDNTTPDVGADVHPDAPGDASDGGPTCILPDAASGTLDLTFNNGTKAVGGSFLSRAATIATDGSIYVIGSVASCTSTAGQFSFGILHVLQNGSIDPVFAPGNSPLCLKFSPLDFGFAAAMLPGNNPLFGGSSGNGASSGFATLVSLTSDAGPNNGFNLNGQELLTAGAGTVVGSGCGNPQLSDTSPTLTTINSIAVSSTGKIAIVGSNAVNVCDPADFVPAGSAGFVLQLNSDGSPDSAFNSGNPLKDSTVAGFYGVTYDSAGNIVTVGQNAAYLAADASVVRTASVRRFTPSATADGSIEVSATGGMIGRSVIVTPDGHVMIGGSSNIQWPTYGGVLTVMRLTSALALDTGFNGGAPLTLAPLTLDAFVQYSSLAVLCNGAVLAAGTWTSDGGTQQDLALAKVTPTGALDTTFGTGGIAIDLVSGYQIPVGVAQDPTTGKVVVVGRDTVPHLVIARFNP
jgi:uncharacterized delta-60 repeat protein